MLPTFPPKSILFGAARYLVKPKPGLPIVFKRNNRLYIKRLKRISDQGYWVEGDNLARSVDSRSFGAIPETDIVATIVFRLR